MKVTLLTAVALTTVALCSAASDPECKYRKSRKLPMHWANPTDCGRFYRCTNKSVKREVVCAKGKVYDTTVGKCADDAPGLCNLTLPNALTEGDDVCNGKANGVSVPKTGYCRDYYVCFVNQGTLQECEPGEYFDESASDCVPDTDSTCWQNFCLEKSDGTALPDDTNCLSYYSCNDKETTKERCAAGEYFASSDGSCQPDPNGEQCAHNLCNGVPDGTFVENPADCHAFYICNKGLAVPQDCGTGSYFDPTALSCQPGDCDSSSDCTTESTTPCPSDVTTTPCPGGDVAETTAVSVDGHVISTCTGGYTEGQFVAHPSNLQLFYICADGKLVENSCLRGNKFDAKLGACVSEIKKTRGNREKHSAAKDDAVPAKEARHGLNALKLPLKSEMITVPIEVPSEDGQRKWNLDDTAAFFVSGSGKKTPQETIDDSKTFFELANLKLKPRESALYDFDPIEGEMAPFVAVEPVTETTAAPESTATAVIEPVTEAETVERDPNHVAPNCHGIYYEGQLVKHPQHCRKFLVCHDGKMKSGDCGGGNYYNATVNSCTVDYYHQCTDENALMSGVDEAAPAAGQTDSNCTCPGGEKEGTKLPNLYYGYLFYTCVDQKWVLGNCSIGNCFNANTGDCEVDTDNACWPADICKGQPNDATMSDPNNCAAFYMCTNGVGKLTNCPTGKYFKQLDSNHGYCETDVDAVCLNPCAGTTGIVFLPIFDDPVKYYMCNNGVTYVETCTVGYFDVTLGRCHPDAVNEKTLCLNQVDGTTFPVVSDQSKFYMCVSGVATIENCLLDTEYDNNVGVCLPVPSASCNQTLCVGIGADDYFPPIAGKGNSSAFCACRGEAAYIHYCPGGYTFREDLNVCYSNAPCDPDLCTYMPENTRSENRNDTTSFCLCVMRQQVIVDCPGEAVFNPATNLCQPIPVQNENCNASYCLTHADYTIFPALYNNVDGFCVCMNTGSEYIPCQDGKQFNADMGLCLPVDPTSVCPPANCQNNAGLIFAANGPNNSFCYCSDDSTAVLRSCPNNEDFDETLLICMAKGCDANFCLADPEGPFPADNDPYSFCLCTDTAAVTKMACPNGDRFDIHKLVCRLDPCNKNFCVNPNNNGIPYAATNYSGGFCMCNNGYPILHDCENDYLFDTVAGVCVPPVQLECNITLCAQATLAAPYPIPAINDPYSFCYCFSSDTVDLFHCPEGTVYTNASYCESEFPDSGNPNNPSGPVFPPTDPNDDCICPGGYTAGQMVPVKDDCRAVAICQNGKLQKIDCGTGNYYNPYTESCQVDTMGTCISPAAYNCIGAYREGEYVQHPTNSQLYYLCYNAVLSAGDCGSGNVFDVADQMCKPMVEVGKRYLRSAVDATVAEDDDSCVEDEKQPVAANCAQYDVCLDGEWVRRNCSHTRYYNAALQMCQEPRDDTVCAFARVSGLPPCSDDAMQQRTLSAKGANCAQFYRCSGGKWRLQSCPPQHFYSTQWHTCLPTGHADVCRARNNTPHVEDAAQRQCRHTAVRHYAADCAMYLMCLEDDWWYQYCPLGMYFSRTHNYCLPNDAGQCDSATHTPAVSIAPADDEFAAQRCGVEGALRASALACDRYYVCASGRWHPQNCVAAHYFNITAEACVHDEEGICDKGLLATGCVENERRAFPLNCTAYEQCEGGVWQRTGCAANGAFDDVLRVCVPNDGGCSRSGLRKACHAGESRPLPLAGNCTQFYYCQDDSWQVGACLLGHFYWPAAGGCVPHAANDECQPLWQANAPADEVEENTSTACVDRADGATVAHPDNCRRFFLCVAETTATEQECVHGSFFDAELGYCRPNDGSCRVPLSGVCANATDESRVPHANDCRAYYHCSTITGTQLVYCPEGEYYHNYTRQCRADHGECRQQPLDNDADSKCAGTKHGMRLPHKRYCNIYYACVRGLAIPVECADDYRFSAALGRCIYDEAHECEDGQLSDNNTSSYSCGNLTDGTHLPDRIDCTRYYVCAEGVALPKRCVSGAYFDAQQLLCVPDDGSCPYVYDDQPNHPAAPPDPIVCEGKHGYLLPDPANCNEFYVCVNGKLRHERCYTNHHFNATMAQCQQREQETSDMAATLLSNATAKSSQCADKPTDFDDLCAQIPEGSSIAEQGDCRRYISCEDDEPTSQRCRNGESYDSLLGICRQNDGTCLLENGQRVGDCNGRHGQLARDADNCRGYYVCINGQKIPGECAADEYFSKSENMCQPDVSSQCSASSGGPDEAQALACNGLSEAVLYPYVHDNCRSYFQCIKGVAKVHECADGLYFNDTLIRCVRKIHECVMPATNFQRAPEVVHAQRGICENAKVGERYANVDDHCRSYYVCDSDGSLSISSCAGDTLFNTDSGGCEEARTVLCRI